MADVRAASLGDVASDRPTPAELDGVRVVLARVGDRVYALAGTCAHRGGPLGEGKLSGTRLACPWHGWIYDVRTGQCAFPGRGEAVASYGVRVDGDDVWVRLPDASEGQR